LNKTFHQYGKLNRFHSSCHNLEVGAQTTHVSSVSHHEIGQYKEATWIVNCITKTT